jgi:hypothetical protein
MAQAVGRRPLTAETRGQLQASPLVICGGESCTGHFHLDGRSALRRGTAAFALRMQETKVRLAAPVACSHFDRVTHFRSLVSVTKLWWWGVA